MSIRICLINIYVVLILSILAIIEATTITWAQFTHGDYIFMLIGYFNIEINSNNKQSKQLLEHMRREQLQEVTTKFISGNKTIIDHIWTNFPVQQCHVHISHSYLSGHDVGYACPHFVSF